jgi:pyrroline-5-carboxylate reductase
MFIEAMADGGVKCGLSRSTAQLLAAQTLVGAAELCIQSEKHPGELKDEVCSPGGSTIAGVAALENGKFRAAVIDAVESAYKRTKEL